MSGASPGDPGVPRDPGRPRGHRDPRDVFVESVLALVTTPEMTDALNDFVRDVAEALHVDAVGILVRGPSGEAELLCATSHRMAELAIYAVGHEEGPCVESLRSGVGVIMTGEAICARWPSVGPYIEAAGFRMITTIPMLWQDAPVGSLNVFRRSPQELTAAEMRLAQSFAAVATLALGQGSTNDRVAGSVVSVLNGRVVIEQAKGILFQQRGIDMQETYEALRAMAESSGRSVSQTARDLISDAQRRP